MRLANLREFEQIKKNYDALSSENEELRRKISKDVSQLKTDNTCIQDERDKYKKQITTLTKENESLNTMI